MNKVIALFVTFMMSLNILPQTVFASDTDNLDLPEAGNKYGYLFTLTDNSDLIDTKKYNNIKPVFEEAKIYFAQDLDDIKALTDEYDIEFVEANAPLEEPEPIEVENSNTEITLFSEDDIGSDETEEPETIEQRVNDPLYPYQWSHEATNIDAYWDNGITGEGITVGVIDSGINREHTAFEGVDIETGINVCAYIRNDEDKMYDTTDESGHGTAMASIICSAINDGIGMAGITDKVTVIPYKIEDDDYPDLTGAALIQALSLVKDDNCDVVNISYGGTASSESIAKSINKAVDELASRGIIVCAATGNSGLGGPIEYPAAAENAIGVAAIEPDGCEYIQLVTRKDTGEILGTDPDKVFEDYGFTVSEWNSLIRITRGYTVSSDTKYKACSYSTGNESVFISAPANYIAIANYSNNEMFEIRGAGGTSSATPVIAAAAIGVKQMRPETTVDEFKEILKATAIDLGEEGYDISTGYGMVDFEGIYNYVQQMPDAVDVDITNNENISVSCEDCVYSADVEKNKQIPTITYTDENGKTLELEEGWHYEITEYKNYENAGTATMTINGIEGHGYIGTLEISYKIKPADISNSGIVIVNIPDQTYTGEAVTPIPVLKSDEIELTYGVDYTVKYSDNTNPGTATVEIMGIGNFNSNSKLVTTFNIVDSNNIYNPTPDKTPEPIEPPGNYDVKAYFEYDENTKTAKLHTKNNTSADIKTAGTVAVYDKNGVLKYTEKRVVVAEGEVITPVQYSNLEGCTIKYYMWDSLTTMKPYESFYCEEFTIE